MLHCNKEVALPRKLVHLFSSMLITLGLFAGVIQVMAVGA
jgi:hypothetical protein